MLVNDDAAMRDNSGGILMMIASASGRPLGAHRIRDGVYEIGHFGSSHWPLGYEDHPRFSDTNFGCYGVCDNVEQILAACPEIETSESRAFVITLTTIRRADEPREGGWRWHKWGEYIGTFKPAHEHIADETGIDEVFVYHVYERKP